MKATILKGDTVMIRRGKERGKRGTVKGVQSAAGTATVEGVNVVKRHTKQGTKSSNMGASTQTGGIIEKEAAMPISALQYATASHHRNEVMSKTGDVSIDVLQQSASTELQDNAALAADREIGRAHV